MCYIEQNDQYLMLYRNKRKKDVNGGKWIGVGGHLIDGETIEQCLLREVYEETGLTLLNYTYCGILHFDIDGLMEDCHLYISDSFKGHLKECDEGELHWVDKKDIRNLKLWEGDYLFLDKINPFKEFFEMKLVYRNDILVEHEVLNV